MEARGEGGLAAGLGESECWFFIVLGDSVLRLEWLTVCGWQARTKSLYRAQGPKSSSTSAGLRGYRECEYVGAYFFVGFSEQITIEKEFNQQGMGKLDEITYLQYSIHA